MRWWRRTRPGRRRRGRPRPPPPDWGAAVDRPFVSVVVVNYNGLRHLDGCLGALAAQTYPRHLFEVILVDNASRDGSVGFVRGRFPWVELVPLDFNAGFAEGNRHGLDRA